MTKKPKLIKDAAENYVLHINGAPMICPFRSPILVPGQLAGQVGLVNSNCGTNCPLFSINDQPVNGYFAVQLGCDRGHKTRLTETQFFEEHDGNNMKLSP